MFFWNPFSEFFSSSDIGPILDVALIKIFSHYGACHLNNEVLCLTEAIQLLDSHLLIVDLRTWANAVLFSLLLCHWDQSYSLVSLVFGSVLMLKFQSIWIIILFRVTWFSLDSSKHHHPFQQHHLSFFQGVFLASLSKIRCLLVCGLMSVTSIWFPCYSFSESIWLFWVILFSQIPAENCPLRIGEKLCVEILKRIILNL